MADSENKQDETTTTSEVVTDTTTAAPAVAPVSEKHGEVIIDEGATAAGLQEQTSDERLKAAWDEGVRNHNIEHSTDTRDYETEISDDKVE